LLVLEEKIHITVVVVPEIVVVLVLELQVLFVLFGLDAQDNSQVPAWAHHKVKIGNSKDDNYIWFWNFNREDSFWSSTA
jgi:hypothetical protein